jgi:uncharacterized membrane protein
MDVPRRRADLLAYTAIGIAVLAGLVLWSDLPPEMAIHFGAGGEPDDFVARPVGVFLTPTIGVAAVLLIRRGRNLGTNLDTRMGSANAAVEDAAVAFVGVVVAYAHGLVLVWNVGLEFDVPVAILPVLGLPGGVVAFTLWREGRLPARG